MLVTRSISSPAREGLTWYQMWKGDDQGLISAWERGRVKSQEDPALSAKATQGELVVLAWKGGVEKAIKGKKHGSLLYLAMWQGLRGDDLNVDTEKEIDVKCSRTDVVVTYTFDFNKIKNNL